VNKARIDAIRDEVARLDPDVGTIFANRDGVEILQLTRDGRFIEINLCVDDGTPMEVFVERILVPRINILRFYEKQDAVA